MYRLQRDNYWDETYDDAFGLRRTFVKEKDVLAIIFNVYRISTSRQRLAISCRRVIANNRHFPVNYCYYLYHATKIIIAVFASGLKAKYIVPSAVVPNFIAHLSISSKCRIFIATLGRMVLSLTIRRKRFFILRLYWLHSSKESFTSRQRRSEVAGRMKEIPMVINRKQ